jgi:MATE family multidrug resistance protein
VWQAEPAREPWTVDLRLLLLISLPNVASTAAETALSFVDFFIVSYLGAPAQAAVQSGGLVFFTVFAFLLGMMACVSTMVSQSLGAKRPRDCSSYAWQGVWVSVAYGLIGVAVWPIVPAFFAWTGHAPDVQVMEVGYTRIRMLSLGMAGMSCAIGHFFIGVHRPLINAVSVVMSNVVNGFLSYGLVLGAWGLPEMGVEGAAMGSLISSALRALLLVVAMCFSRKTAEFEAVSTAGLDWDRMRRLVAVGWPAGLAFFCDISAWAVFMVVIVGSFGTLHMAAMSICWRYVELSFMPAVGIGLAVSAVVGKAMGEGRPELARRRAALGAAMNMAYMGTVGVAFVLFGPSMMGFFSGEEAVISLGTRLMLFAAAFQLFDAIAINYSNALRGAGDTKWPAVAGALLAWSIMVGGGLVVSRTLPQLGALGPWSMATTFVFAIGITLWIRWRGGVWKHLDVIGRKEPVLVDYEPSLTEAVIAEPAVPAEPAEDPALATEPRSV